MCSLSCVWAPLLSDTVLSPAVCAWWAPPASHSYSQRYLQIPADKTIICSASPWFRASGCVWCLPLVKLIRERLQIRDSAPYVYFHPTVSPDRPLVLSCLFLLFGFQQLELVVYQLCINTCGGGGLLAGCKKLLWHVTEGTYGKMFKRDTYTVEPKQGEQKRTLQDEVIVLVELKWQNTNTFRSTVNRQKEILPQNPKRFKAWMKFEQ